MPEPTLRQRRDSSCETDGQRAMTRFNGTRLDYNTLFR